MGSAGAAVPMLKRPGRRGRRQSSNTISKLKRPLRCSEPQNSTSKLKGKPARLAQPRIIMSLRSFGDTCLPYILVSIKTLRALVPPTSTWHRQHPNPAVVTCTKDSSLEAVGGGRVWPWLYSCCTRHRHQHHHNVDYSFSRSVKQCTSRELLICLSCCTRVPSLSHDLLQLAKVIGIRSKSHKQAPQPPF
jgi:hypothetical protein